MCKLDLSKPVQTKEGRPARIICTDKKGDPRTPLVVLIECEKGEYCHVYTTDGKPMWQGEEYTLVNITEVKKTYRLIRNTGTQSAIVYADVNEAHRNLLVSDDRWVGLQETVFTDGKITQINFILR